MSYLFLKKYIYKIGTTSINDDWRYIIIIINISIYHNTFDFVKYLAYSQRGGELIPPKTLS
jgi:hypothetical protein